MFGCQDDKTLVSMITKKKKAVVVLSTMHDCDTTDEDTKKPTQIVDYNFTKDGVDTVDLMCSRISTSRRTQRWPVTIFFRLLDLAGMNSLRIFQFNVHHIKNNTRRPYLYELSLEMMNDNLKERSNINNLPKELKVFLEPYKEQVCTTDEPARPKRGILVCYICGFRKNNKTRKECKGCGKNVCKQHSFTYITCNICQPPSQDEGSDMDENYYVNDHTVVV